jgi:dynein heavy chain
MLRVWGWVQMIEDYWESSKKMLADSDFLKSLKEYDKDNISPDIIIKIRPYVVILLIKLQPALSFVLLKSFVVHERYCTYM